jgi:aerobic-type carbon monoxide dehydrogenase small subunit (CoxS/CutS family)
MQVVELIVNGTTYHLEADPDTSLLTILRNNLGLKGAKYACGQEQCGACNVLIDGQAVPSCHVSVGSVRGSEIVTIEGLGTPENLHPLQETFIEEQATQCGYCTPGMVVGAQGLLNRVRYPTEGQINEALDGHLCRCGTHERVRRAIKLRIARPAKDPLYEVRDLEPLPERKRALSSSLREFPDLDSWIKINPDETITVCSGKVEYGQGIKTALAQIAADELDVSLHRIEMVMGDSERTPDEGLTVGSMSLETSGEAIRQAAAEARQLLLQVAIEELEAWPEDLVVEDGQITDRASGKSTSYWQLYGGKSLGRQIKGLARPKGANSYTLVGQSVKRVDLTAKVTGTHVYVQDLAMEDMLHARVIRPPSYGATLQSVDPELVERMPGVQKVVRDRNFLGVIAEGEENVVRAMERLAAVAVWDKVPIPSEQASLYH